MAISAQLDSAISLYPSRPTRVHVDTYTYLPFSCSVLV